MSKSTFPEVTAAGKKRVLNVRSDPIDIRDRMYEPALINLKDKVDHRAGTYILDQGKEGACTGFGLAAVINQLNKNRRLKVSARMLYEMAKKHDEWPGEDYTGSSCRGAIKGWKNMGVCTEKQWPYVINNHGELTVERAIAARSNTLGAYYRLRPEINDYHTALNEVPAIYVSADVHKGWFNPKSKNKNQMARIQPYKVIEGGHAFAIVGYNTDGFIVQNSWGNKWGSRGFALWLYEDWLENISDGWVFRLAIPTPQIFGLSSRPQSIESAEFGGSVPKRIEIAGHFVHFDDGKFKPRGYYWSTADDIQRTAERLRESVIKNKYKHLLIYAHGGLNSTEASARRIKTLKEGFKRNGIYPFHIMYDTGLVEEIKDAVTRAFKQKGERAEGFISDLKDKIIERSDLLIEDTVRKPVTAIWDEMKRDARLPYETNGSGNVSDGLYVIKTFSEILKGTNLYIHIAGHSTGAVLIGHLLDALDILNRPDLVKSCSLMAPACTIDFYKQHYEPRLTGSGGTNIIIPRLDIYNLIDQLELDDNVAYVYRKSLLFLVSNALERMKQKPILGMERYSKKLSSKAALKISYSNGKTGITRSTSHGGFDNDIFTMNAILKRILGKTPQFPFRKDEMVGY